MLHAEAWRPTVIRPLLSALSRRPDPFERLVLQEYPKVVAIAYRVLGDGAAAVHSARSTRFGASGAGRSARRPTRSIARQASATDAAYLVEAAGGAAGG